MIDTFYKDYPEKLTATSLPIDSIPPIAKLFAKPLAQTLKQKQDLSTKTLSKILSMFPCRYKCKALVKVMANDFRQYYSYFTGYAFCSMTNISDYVKTIYFSISFFSHPSHISSLSFPSSFSSLLAVVSPLA